MRYLVAFCVNVQSTNETTHIKPSNILHEKVKKRNNNKKKRGTKREKINTTDEEIAVNIFSFFGRRNVRIERKE